jgi:hypothetical protein
LCGEILAAQKAVHEALLDTINTRGAMDALVELIR